MQIHELNTFPGKPGSTDYLAIDSGFDTAKISADKFLETKVNQPIDEHNQYDNGVAGQLLRTNGDGSTEWVDQGLPTDAQTAQAISDWLAAHPEATTTVQDGSLTEAKFSQALQLKTLKDYVTPEMYGAIGDGVADDTIAVQAALDSGKSVIGTGVYKIGEPGIAYYYPVTITVPWIKVIGSFIDGRSYLTTSNNKNYGAFLINADNVELDINIYNDNALPVDDADPNNLSDVGGYAVTIEDGVENATIKVRCQKMNGVYAKGLFYNSDINIMAEVSAYPYAGICAIDSSIKINVNKCHRVFWGACNGSFVRIQAKNYYSTGNSSHILVCAVNHNGSVYHCLDSIFEIIDTGSTDYNSGAHYFDVSNDIGETSIARLIVTLIGDISNSDNGVFVAATSGTGSLINGTLTIFNNLKTDYENAVLSKIYTGVNITVYDSQYEKIDIDTTEKINASLNGLNSDDGAVYISHLHAGSHIRISDYNAVLNYGNQYNVYAYQNFVVKNVFTFNPSKFYRCTVINGVQYLDGNPV